MRPAGLRKPSATVLVVLAAGAIAPAAASAQLAVTANGGTVRYESATTEQTAALSPEFRLEGRHAAFQLQAELTGGSDGSRIASGGPSLWLATSPLIRHIQLDAQGSFRYTSPRGDSSSYAALGIGELALTTDGPGLAVGAGGGTAQIAGTSAVTVLKARARAWFDAGPVSVALAAEPTRLEGSWYSDFSAEFDTETGHLEASLTGRLRQSRTSGTSAGGELETAWHLTPAIALLVSGGRYLREPFEGLPEGDFVTVGLKFLLWRPHVADHGGVSESALNDVNFGSDAHLLGHGRGSALLPSRSVPGIAKKSGSTTSGTGSSTGRGHKP